MQTFTFSELDSRGQAATLDHYIPQIINETPSEIDERSMEAEAFVKGYMIGAGWRFNEHGERIA